MLSFVPAQVYRGNTTVIPKLEGIGTVLASQIREAVEEKEGHSFPERRGQMPPYTFTSTGILIADAGFAPEEEFHARKKA